MQVLDPRIIKWFCRVCNKTTEHETITKDSWTKKYRRLKQLNYASPKKRLRRCLECGNIVEV